MRVEREETRRTERRKGLKNASTQHTSFDFGPLSKEGMLGGKLDLDTAATIYMIQHSARSRNVTQLLE